MIGTKNFNWRNRKLYLGSKPSGFSVVFHSGLLYGSGVAGDEEPGKMFKVEYPDKEVSKDFYNLTRAKDHCIYEASKHFNSVENGAREART